MKVPPSKWYFCVMVVCFCVVFKNVPLYRWYIWILVVYFIALYKMFDYGAA